MSTLSRLVPAISTKSKLLHSFYIINRAASSSSPTPAWKFIAPPKEVWNYAKKYRFSPPGAHHTQNPYKKPHHISKYWEPIFYYVMLPLTFISLVRALYLEHEEDKHIKERRPPYVPVEYLRIIRTPFPWGDGKTPLFYNPKRNPLPGIGYVDDD